MCAGGKRLVGEIIGRRPHTRAALLSRAATEPHRARLGPAGRRSLTRSAPALVVSAIPRNERDFALRDAQPLTALVIHLACRKLERIPNDVQRRAQHLMNIHVMPLDDEFRKR